MLETEAGGDPREIGNRSAWADPHEGTMSVSETLELPLLLSPNAASAAIGISATRLREAVRLGRLPAVMVGSHVRITRDALAAYVANLPAYRKAARPGRSTSRKPARAKQH
jgi:excisionase family DNA binding protein